MLHQSSYLIRRGNVFYFSRRVPFDLQSQFNKNRITISLRTGSQEKALISAANMSHRLELYWERIRLENFHTKELGLGLVLQTQSEPRNKDVSLTAALADYLRLKGGAKDKTFRQSSTRNIGYLIDSLGHDQLSQITPVDAGAFRDFLLARDLSPSSVRRIFSSVKAVINLAIKENGLDLSNAFTKTYIPTESAPTERPPVPLRDIRVIQSECYQLDDENRWLVTLVADTGMRLAEAVGLKSSDLIIEADHPHVRVMPHPWRGLKTAGSARNIPLVGSAHWAATQIKKSGSEFAFPKYCSVKQCSSNSASAAINKWLKPRVPKGCVIHSFRHSLRDRLRAVECPSDIVDALGGWATAGVGQKYGQGYDMQVKHRWMARLEE